MGPVPPVGLKSSSLSHSILTLQSTLPSLKDDDQRGSPSFLSCSLFIVFENILTGFFEEQFRNISRSVSQDTFLSSTRVHVLKVDVE